MAASTPDHWYHRFLVIIGASTVRSDTGRHPHRIMRLVVTFEGMDQGNHPDPQMRALPTLWPSLMPTITLDPPHRVVWRDIVASTVRPDTGRHSHIVMRLVAAFEGMNRGNHPDPQIRALPTLWPSLMPIITLEPHHL